MAELTFGVTELALFGVIALVTIVTAGAFSKKLGVAAPLILIVVGVGFSFIPGAPVQVPYELILFGLLPPILYSAAINVPVIDFRRNFTSISMLSVVLVVVTSVGTGFLLFWIFPQLSLPAAIAVGAVISPTDAVAATALGKKLGLPPRLVSILEGESLVNDATALVLLRSAIAATAAAVSFWGVVADFAFAVAVALAIGLVVGFATVWVRSKIADPLLDTAISFAVPFIAFIPTEFVDASGVLAVVVAGLYSGHYGAKHFSAQARISERLNWRTLQFVLENGVFLLMGIEISYLISSVHEDDLGVDKAVYVGLLMVVAVIVIRFVFMVPLILLLRRQTRRAEASQDRWGTMLDRVRGRAESDERLQNSARFTKRLASTQRSFERRQADLEQQRAEGLGWRGGVILGWSGMRGVVTLAAAQSLPNDGSIPYRPQLVLIAFTVAIATLLLQGSTLPWVIRLTRIPGADKTADRRELASLLDDLGAAGAAVLENPSLGLPAEQTVDPAVVERVRADMKITSEAAWERVERGTDDDDQVRPPHWQYRALRREVLQAERAALLEARSAGVYPSRILRQAQAMLDLEETRLEAADGGVAP